MPKIRICESCRYYERQIKNFGRCTMFYAENSNYLKRTDVVILRTIKYVNITVKGMSSVDKRDSYIESAAYVGRNFSCKHWTG